MYCIVYPGIEVLPEDPTQMKDGDEDEKRGITYKIMKNKVTFKLPFQQTIYCDSRNILRKNYT